MIALTTDIFLVEELQSADGVIKAQLKINQGSAIFNGHFPGQPVVPGACILQLVKDVLEEVLNTSLMLKKANHLKFISMIVPENSGDITLDISYKEGEYQEIKSIAKIIIGTGVYFKFHGDFKAI